MSTTLPPSTPDSTQIPAWFVLAYDIVLSAMFTGDLEDKDSMARLGLINTVGALHSVKTPFEAVELFKNASRAVFQEADLMACAVCGGTALEGATASSLSTLDQAYPYRTLDQAYAYYQSQGGRAEVRNSTRAHTVRRIAIDAFTDLAQSDCAMYNQENGPSFIRIKRRKSGGFSVAFHTISADIRDAFACRATIDLLGMHRRVLENIINPAAAGLGLQPVEHEYVVGIVTEHIGKAQKALAFATYHNFPSWQPTATHSQHLADVLRASLDYERNQIAGLTNPSEAYKRFVQAAKAEEGKGNTEAAAVNYLQAGAVARFVQDIEGAEVLTNYEKGITLLNQLPDGPTKNGWLANVRDHAPDLTRRYPGLQARVEALSRSATPDTPAL